MRITKISIRNYRSIKHLELELDDYSVLIGANGTGKSSVLYALDWFFNRRSLAPEDVHRADGDPPGTPDRDISVEVTFSDLTNADRLELGKYGRGPVAWFRKSWSASSNHEKQVGNAHQGPGFAHVRNAGTAAEMKAAYLALQESRPELALPTATTKKAIEAALDEWEGDSGNTHLFEPIDDSDATHMFGVQGEHRLANRIGYVLIPAATDIASQIGETGRDSALSQLIGNLLSRAVTTARDGWLGQNAAAIKQLSDDIENSVSKAATSHASRVNSHLATLLPQATVGFSSQLPEWTPRIDPSLTTSVAFDGRTHDASRQGHGVQRAVMMAMLQAITPNGSSDDGVGAEPGVASNPDQPALVVAIEEPEIYQHPVRARHLARALWDLSQSKATQVFAATHSPYFVRPEQFAGLRRISLQKSCSICTTTTVSKVAAACGTSDDDVRRRLEQELPQTFSEGFFADVAVLVEGDSDKVLLETIAERLGLALDAAGVAVLSVGGKGSLLMAHQLLSQLGTRTFVVVDGDYLGAKRKHPDNEVNQQKARNSHEASTRKVLTWLLGKSNDAALYGSPPCKFGSQTIVTNRFLYFHDDIEHEIDSWSEYQNKLADLNAAPRAKDVGAYRAAALQAGDAGIPQSIRIAIDTIVNLRSA